MPRWASAARAALASSIGQEALPHGFDVAPERWARPSRSWPAAIWTTRSRPWGHPTRPTPTAALASRASVRRWRTSSRRRSRTVSSGPAGDRRQPDAPSGCCGRGRRPPPLPIGWRAGPPVAEGEQDSTAAPIGEQGADGGEVDVAPVPLAGDIGRPIVSNGHVPNARVRRFAPCRNVALVMRLGTLPLRSQGVRGRFVAGDHLRATRWRGSSPSR